MGYSIAFTVVAILPLITGGGCGESPAPAPPPAANRLHADHTDIVDERGTPVQLRGLNLGAWMFHETWISAVDYDEVGRAHVLGGTRGVGAEVDAALVSVGPGSGDAWRARLGVELDARIGAPAATDFITMLATFPSVADDSDLPLRQQLERRFGTEGRDELIDVFQGSWLGESDIAWIAEQGFSVVRVPMGYRSLVTASDLVAPVAPLVWNERAFARLSTLLDWCEGHDVYAVLDLQESPGGHNDYSGPARLYADPAMQALTVDVWTEIARRYGDRDIVAAYSLLAEPFSAPSATERDEMYDRLIRAIRETGDDHLVIIHDGFKGMQSLPVPAKYGWTNAVYSTHLFEWDVKSAADYEARVTVFDLLFSESQARQDVPYYIGSFSTIEDQAWAYEGGQAMLALFERKGWSWSAWTYKRIDDPIASELYGTKTAWGLRGRLRSSLRRPDVYLDDRATLAAKLAAYQELVLDVNDELLTMLTSWR